MSEKSKELIEFKKDKVKEYRKNMEIPDDIPDELITVYMINLLLKEIRKGK